MNRRRSFLTPEGRDRLQAELDELRAVRRPDVAARIHIASESGGAVDNAEYEEVKNEQAFVEGRILDLERILANSIVAAPNAKTPDVAQIGASVTVEGARRRKRKYKLVGSVEAEPLEGKISNESPVGRALMNRRKGDVVEVKTPSGVRKLKIVAIE